MGEVLARMGAICRKGRENQRLVGVELKLLLAVFSIDKNGLSYLNIGTFAGPILKAPFSDNV